MPFPPVWAIAWEDEANTEIPPDRAADTAGREVAWFYARFLASPGELGLAPPCG